MTLLGLDFLRATQAIILLFGAIVVYFALKSYRRRKSLAMLLLGSGFGFVTIGAVVAGILFELLNVDLVTVESIQSTFQVIGFFQIVYSLTTSRD
jgi:hypothetical protein